MTKELGIYVHIPFCKSKCNYCDFYSLGGMDRSFDRYETALRKHIRESAEYLEDRDVDTIYFGGGTPSHFGAKRLAAVLSEIEKRFYLADDMEITFEANPDSVELQSLQKLRRAGFNRISLGVQSTNNEDLKTLGRPHTWERAKRAFAMCRDAGFKNVSIDLMYGLPGQSLKAWQTVLEAALELDPEHISCYGLKIEQGTPFAKRVNELELPDDDMQADMYLWTAEELAARGYYHYEISNFAKKGYASKHNLKYWTLKEYLGFGPSASSDLNDRRFTCIRDVAEYIKRIREGGDVVAESEELPLKARAGEYIMLSLRTSRGISESEYTNRYGEGFEKMKPYFKKLISGDFARCTEDRYRLTPRGFLVSNTIISELLSSL